MTETLTVSDYELLEEIREFNHKNNKNKFLVGDGWVELDPSEYGKI